MQRLRRRRHHIRVYSKDGRVKDKVVKELLVKLGNQI
jgi:hypothetical protein